MSETAIQALERKENPKQARKNGFVPGVIYGKGMEAISVKFDERKLLKTLGGRIQKSKISVQLGEETKQCFIKEIQKDVLLGKTIHIALHAVEDDQVIKMKVPLFYTGSDILNERRMLVLPYCSEVELVGPSVDIPDVISVDVSNLKVGRKITVADLKVPSTVKITDDPEKVLAAITVAK